MLESTALWCPQCRAIAPFVDEAREKFLKARFYTYDADSVGDIAQESEVNSMPTSHRYKDGELGDSVTSAKAKEV